MNALGKHLLLELQGCDKEALNDIGFIRSTMLAAARDCGATILGESFHQFSPQGVSGTVIVAESHLFIHTWPEYGYAAADVFTCGDTVQPEKAVGVLVSELDSQSHSLVEMRRGILETAGSGVG